MLVFAEEPAAPVQEEAAHGLAAPATQPDFHSEPVTVDENVALKSPTIPPCLIAVTSPLSRFLVNFGFGSVSADFDRFWPI